MIEQVAPARQRQVLVQVGADRRVDLGEEPLREVTGIHALDDDPVPALCRVRVDHVVRPARVRANTIDGATAAILFDEEGAGDPRLGVELRLPFPVPFLGVGRHHLDDQHLDQHDEHLSGDTDTVCGIYSIGGFE